MLRMKELRGKRTQAAVAKQLGLTQRTYQNYEIGARQADYETLAKIAQFYKVSIEYMLGIDNNVSSANDYANGVVETKQVRITADQDELLELFDEMNEQQKQLFVEMGKTILKIQ